MATSELHCMGKKTRLQQQQKEQTNKTKQKSQNPAIHIGINYLQSVILLIL